MRGVACQQVSRPVLRQQTGQRQPVRVPQPEFVVTDMLVDRGAEQRHQPIPLALVFPQLHEPLHRQRLRRDLSARLIDEPPLVLQQPLRVGLQGLQRRRRHRRLPRHLRSSELQPDHPRQVLPQRPEPLSRRALVGRTRQQHHVHRQHPRPRLRPEPGPELLRELDPLLHAVVHVRVAMRVQLAVACRLDRGLQHLEPSRIIFAGLRHLIVVLGEAADVLRQLLERGPLLRALQHHSQPALGDARVQLGDIRVPRRIRRLVAPDVVVRPRCEVVQILHGEQLLPEPVPRHRQRLPAILLLQLPHQLVPPVGEPELGTPFQLPVLRSPTGDLVAGQQ